MRTTLVLAVVLFAIRTERTALAHPPPEIAEDPPVEWRETPAILEWSTWFRLGFGVASTPPAVIARTTQPTAPGPAQATTWETGLGAEVSLPLGRRVRLGGFAELQGLEPAGGVELLVTRAPGDVDLFWYHGEGVWIVRGGGSATHATAAIAWGYRCPWKLWGPYDRTSRYEIGARIVLSASRAYDDPSDWSTTLGLEVEPVGAIRYLFGVRSWY